MTAPRGKFCNRGKDLFALQLNQKLKENSTMKNELFAGLAFFPTIGVLPQLTFGSIYRPDQQKYCTSKRADISYKGC